MRFIAFPVLFAVLNGLSGCGSVSEKTAPCKRPANALGYASGPLICGPMKRVNADPQAALRTIDVLARE